MADTNVQYDNLAGIIVHKQDGNLYPVAPTPGPKLLVIGTASQGVGSTLYNVSTTSTAKVQFGTDGTLLRGMWEGRN